MKAIARAKNRENGELWAVEAPDLTTALLELAQAVPPPMAEETLAAVTIALFLGEQNGGELQPCWEGGRVELAWQSIA